MVSCPYCKKKKGRLYWDKIVFCESCHTTTVKDDKRFSLVCSFDRSPLLPRVLYKRPTLFCPTCKREFGPPQEIHEEVLEEEI